MSRIQTCFDTLGAENKTALIPFVTAGDPHPHVTVPLMHTLVENGADIIELGIPFSDPMADGPVIQRASERALMHQTSLRDVIAMVEAFRKTNNTTPVVLMGYLNPIEVMGYEAFAKAAHEAGIDGVLTVDIPPEEGADFIEIMKSNKIDPIYLLAPTSTLPRIRKITEAANGFVYYVALKGVTGAGHLDLDTVKEKIELIRTTTKMPIGVGFGIKDAATAKSMAALADAVVVGSALVSLVEENAGDSDKIRAAVGNLIAEIRTAIDEK